MPYKIMEEYRRTNKAKKLNDKDVNDAAESIIEKASKIFFKNDIERARKKFHDNHLVAICNIGFVTHLCMFDLKSRKYLDESRLYEKSRPAILYKEPGT